jgi:hypothetical protein
VDDPRPVPEGVEDAGRLTAVYGEWPDFHDMEVMSLRLDRRDCGAWKGPVLAVDIHVWATDWEVTGSNGAFLRGKHVLATLRFGGLEGLDAGGFNRQNVLGLLSIAPRSSREDGRLHVEFDASFGWECSFTCDRIQVADVRPCTEDGEPLAL